MTRAIPEAGRLAGLRRAIAAATLALSALFATPAAAQHDQGSTISEPPRVRASSGVDATAPDRADADATTPADAARDGAVALPLAPAGELDLPETRGHGRIVVHAEAGMGDLAEHLAARAADVLARIAADLPGLPVPARIELRLVRDAADLGRAAPAGRGAPTWAAGVAYPDVGVVVVATRRGADPLDAEHTTAHELAHLALGAALGERAPRWLHEGFAWQHSPDLGLDRDSTLAGMAWIGSVIPLDDLDVSFPAAELPAARAYAESYDLVSFLARRGRWEDHADDGDRWPFRRFLRYLAQGDDLDRAATRAYGRSMPGLFEEWRGDLRGRYFYYPAAALVGFLWVLAALLLVLAYLRKRRQARRRLGEWGEQERRADAAAVEAPPFVPWPGQSDPLAEPGPTSSELAELASHFPEILIAEATAAEDDDALADADPDEDDEERPDPPRRWIN